MAINYKFNPGGLFTYIRFKLRLPRDKDNIETTIQLVRNGATMTGANLWVLVTAIFLASLGLNVNSTAVIIGAMLISPLMGPIMAIGMGVAIHDFSLVYRAIKNFSLAVFLSVAASTIYFIISPLKVPGSELLARTSPTIYDVLIAVFGGVAGIVAGSSRLRQSNVIPGVAIATALMPPLCTVGFGIARLSFPYILGAFYLFFINTVFISLATYVIVRIQKYPELELLPGKRANRIRRIIISTVIITLVPSIYLTFQIVRKYIFEEKSANYVSTELKSSKRIVLKSEAYYEKEKPVIKITILGAEIEDEEYKTLVQRLGIYGLKGTKLEIQQGFGDVSKKGSVIGSINNSIEANTGAIREIYDLLEGLGDNLSVPEDSVQLKVSRELRQVIPEMQSLSLQSFKYYDGKADTLRSGWRLNIINNGKPPADSTLQWAKRVVALRLKGDSVAILIE